MRARTRLLAGLVALVAAAGCGGDGDDGGEGERAAGGDGGAQVDLGLNRAGTLTVASDIPYAPFEFGRAPDYEGFDIDIVTEIADRLGLELAVEDTSFDTIFRDLAQGKFDLVAASTSITPEREQTVSFSIPYFRADQSLMVRDDSDIGSTADLAGATVGSQKGTTGADYANDETEAESVRTYGEIADAFNALEAGQIDAVINDFAISKYAEESKPRLRVVERIATNENLGLAVGKQSTALLEAVDEQLRAMIDDGTYATLYRKWFEEDPPAEFQGA